jgi:DNA-directed RNA polymerase specialized sigma24 family protein
MSIIITLPYAGFQRENRMFCSRRRPLSFADLTLDTLSERSLAGDPRAEAALFQALRVRFLPIAKRRVQADQAEDLVQDTLRIVFDRYGERNDGPGILVWGLTVLRNVIGNHYQARDREKQRLSFVENLPEEAASPADFLADTEHTQTREALLRAIQELSERFPRCGKIFHHLLVSLEQGGSPNEISTRTLEYVQRENPGMNRGNFYTTLHRCRGQLRTILARREEGFNHG